MNRVEIGEISNTLPSFLSEKNYSKIAVLVDEKTKKYCYKLIKNVLPKHTLIEILAGEKNKNIDTCNKIWEQLTIHNFDRHSLLINLGGGVIGDMGGFCAGTYKRGIDFIQIPTTLLSQVDASVGGKLGIDYKDFKNHIGMFKVPNNVLIYPTFLETLPVSQLRSGFAEVIKHCLIADSKMWQIINKKDLTEQNWPELIAHSVKIKLDITQQDPTEKGLRKILNFGHTLGHAIETHFLNTSSPLLHGEAIAVGMIMEAYISWKLKMITQYELNEIEDFLFTTFGKVKIKNEEIEQILSLTLHDKKNLGSKVRFSLIKGIGNCTYDIEISKKIMAEAINYYNCN